MISTKQGLKLKKKGPSSAIITKIDEDTSKHRKTAKINAYSRIRPKFEMILGVIPPLEYFYLNKD